MESASDIKNSNASERTTVVKKLGRPKGTERIKAGEIDEIATAIFKSGCDVTSPEILRRMRKMKIQVSQSCIVKKLKQCGWIPTQGSCVRWEKRELV